MTKSKIVFCFCLSFICGILFACKISNSPWLFLLGGLFFIFIGLLLKNKKIVVFGFCLFFLMLGILRQNLAEAKIKDNPFKALNNSDKIITIYGKVIEEPDVRENRTVITIKTERGKVLIVTRKYPQYKYGDELKVTGKLKEAPIFEGFNYKDYLRKRGIFSVVYYPEIRVERRINFWKEPFSFLFSKIFDFKEKLRGTIYQNLSPPHSLILGAMVLGDKNRMSESLKEKLNIAGVRHITAVSGLHVFVLSSILMSIFLAFGFWRGQAFYFSLIFIFLFVLMTGLQPSAIRAGIMGGLFLLAQKVGRRAVSGRSVVLAGALMLAFNPFLLLNDIGFQLSFLAVLGIIFFSDFFSGLLRFVPERFLNLKRILIMTFSAYFFTLPLLIYNFGRVSLFAPITNVLILPFVSLVMLLGFIFSLLGIIWQPLSWIFSLPCWTLLTWMVKVINFFSKPWAEKTIENIHWGWIVIFYAFLGYIAWRLKKKKKLEFLDY